MAAMSFLSVIERYHEHESVIHELLDSILLGLSDASIFQNPTSDKVFNELARSYPFVQLLYLLDENGTQVSDNLVVSKGKVKLSDKGRDTDRSHRPYFTGLAEQDSTRYITSPYLSNTGGGLCVSASRQLLNANSQCVIVVVDINLTQLIEFMMGDSARRKMTPIFKAVYSFIVLGLFVLVSVLMWTVVSDIYRLLSEPAQNDPLLPFGIIIFLTLALAIFDLGKTILEEEVLMHKDIFRHSSTRRTITRFISTILIAISIEALLTMFKASLGEKQYIEPAIMMMLAVVGLLVGLGIYVYLGARAEQLLTQNQQQKFNRLS
ncbi:PDC sensor domain-containing protein [Shewanella sp. HL-SH5]|uniref:PDC sensor domain-containing protein n=1 Tax=Shewanella sp. HL-SH5 TaxID=3436241 RepID=UPI003EBE053C